MCPQFLFPGYKPVGVASSSGHQSFLLPYIVLLVAQVVQGIGSAVVYTLGPSIIDSRVPAKDVTVFLGGYYACGNQR